MGRPIPLEGEMSKEMLVDLMRQAELGNVSVYIRRAHGEVGPHFCLYGDNPLACALSTDLETGDYEIIGFSDGDLIVTGPDGGTVPYEDGADHPRVEVREELG